MESEAERTCCPSHRRLTPCHSWVQERRPAHEAPSTHSFPSLAQLYRSRTHPGRADRSTEQQKQTNHSGTVSKLMAERYPAKGGGRREEGGGSTCEAASYTWARCVSCKFPLAPPKMNSFQLGMASTLHAEWFHRGGPHDASAENQVRVSVSTKNRSLNCCTLFQPPYT